jgi:hypothetical protein
MVTNSRLSPLPPCTGEDALVKTLVKTLPAAEAARRTGRTLGAVWARRVLGVPDGRRKENKRD